MVADAGGFGEDGGMDFGAAGLLDGLQGGEREARRRLLEQLAEDGVTIQELKAAVDEDRLALVPVERVLGGRYSGEEVAERTGLPASLMLRIRRLQGLPEAQPQDRVFGDEDIESAKATRLFLEAGISEDALIEITRVMGEAMSRLAATTAAAFVDTFLEPGDREDEVAVRFAELAEQLTPTLTPVLTAAYRAHLRESVRRGMLGRSERETGQLGETQEITVGFADLVGFTRLGGEVELEELGSVAGRLAALAGDVTEPPVRLIKTIGDAAMFVSPKPAALVAAALSLVEAVEEAELPSLRAGIATGPAIQRSGDFYGHSVNLASRVTGIARPGSVLATQEVRDAATDEFEWSFAGRHRLKGVAEPVPLHRARRRPEADAPGEPEASAPERPKPEQPQRKATTKRADRRRRRAAS
jgi:adenylate cyclase